MQKVIRRTENAIKQHARRTAIQREKNAKAKRSLERRQYDPVRRQIQQDFRNARRVRREDWELGSLAPRRNVGKELETYGALDPRRMKGPEKPVEKRRKDFNLAVGDRVVIIEGRDKGNIGTIKEVHRKSDEVTVEGLNMIDVKVPSYMMSEQDKRKVVSIEAAVSYDSVRLVFPLLDEKTGVMRDVIVKDIAKRAPHRGAHMVRYIAGLDVQIPWPKGEPPATPKVYGVDTLSEVVTERTWVPTLLTPPMPTSVIDELRNKYSIFRDRHDPEYIAKKEKEDEEAAARRSSVRMRTPIQQANHRARRERKSKGKRRLTPEMLSKIGEVMASKRARLVKENPTPA